MAAPALFHDTGARSDFGWLTERCDRPPKGDPVKLQFDLAKRLFNGAAGWPELIPASPCPPATPLKALCGPPCRSISSRVNDARAGLETLPQLVDIIDLQIDRAGKARALPG